MQKRKWHLLATDDKVLRREAEKRSIKVIGSLGLLKLLYLKRIIEKKDHYLSFLEKLQEDLYIQEELLEWAKKEI